MNTFEKIWSLIQKDKEIAEKLFLFREIPDDFTPWVGEKMEEYKDYTWLYESDEQRISLIGINKEIDAIDAIDDEGQFRILCEGLENVPYEILRRQCQDENNETLEEVFSWETDRLDVLKRYEDWCKNGGIILDKYNIYHDENGNLFTHYFDAP